MPERSYDSFDRSAAIAYGRLRRHPALPLNTSDLRGIGDSTCDQSRRDADYGRRAIRLDRRGLTTENWHRA
jgi:hypothetical protein